MLMGGETGAWRATRIITAGLVVLLLAITGNTLYAIVTWNGLQNRLSDIQDGYVRIEKQMQQFHRLRQAFSPDGPIARLSSPSNCPTCVPSSPENSTKPLHELIDQTHWLFEKPAERQALTQLHEILSVYETYLHNQDATELDTPKLVTRIEQALRELDNRLIVRMHDHRSAMSQLEDQTPRLLYSITLSGVSLGLLLVLLIYLRKRILETQQRLDRHARELAQNEQRFRSVLATAADAIVIANERGIIQEVNLAAEHMFGYSAEQMQGENLAILMSEEHATHHDSYLQHYLHTGKPTVMGMTNRTTLFAQRSDGSQFPIEVRLSETDTPFGHLFTGIITDVTQRYENDQRLKRQTEDLRILNQIAAHRAETLVERLHHALETALHHLDLQIGIISRIQGNDYRIEHFAAPQDSGLYRGQMLDLGQTYCALTMQENNVVAIDDMGHSQWSGHPCYRAFSLETYIGVPFQVDGATFGTLNLSSASPYPRPFTDNDREFIRLLAAWVGAAIESEAATERLRLSEQRLQRSQTFANIGTWDWNIQNGDLFWSDRVAPLFGYPHGDLETTYENFLGAVHSDDRQAVIDAVNACVEKGAEYNIEHRIVWPNGTVRWVLESGDVVRAEDGIPLNMLGVVQDITARKRAELALKESQERLIQAQKLARLGHWDADLRSGELYWSEVIYDIFGVDPETFTPSVEAFKAAVHPDDRQRVAESEKLAAKSGRHDVVHRLLRPDGAVRYVHELAHMEYGSDGQPTRLRGTVQDITELKQTEAALAESEEKFRGLFELSPVGIALNEMDGRFIEVNDALLRFTGYERDEFKQLSYWQLTPEEYAEQEEQQLVSLRTTGHYGPYEKDYLHKDGHRIPVLLEGLLISDHNGHQRIWSLIQNITERKAADQALLRAKEEAERASRAKSEFLSSMSHELRTPLNAILGFGQLLESDDALDEEQHDSIHEILHAGNHLLELINEVLDLARIESGRVDLSLEGVGLGEILDESLALVQPLAEQRGIKLESAQIDTTVRADRTRLKQVLVNLLGNAIKYNREQGQVEIRVTPQHDYLHIAVSDTGPGIPQERLDELFQPFNRLEAEGSQIEGTGIGLVICKRLTELMGGRIGVDSTAGEGSTFWIELPMLGTAHVQPTAFATPPEQAQRHPSRDYRLLYIEDNPANLKLVSHILAHREHIHLHTAHSAELGLELAEARHPDLILLDINMPGMDGYQLLQVLRSRPWARQLPVIAITANAMPADIQRGLDAGFTDYLTKPLDIPHFLASIEQALEHLATENRED